MCLHFFLRHDVDGIVDIELVVADASEMIPKAMFVLFLVGSRRQQRSHDLHDGIGTSLTLFAVLYLQGHVDHHLYAATILGHHKLLSLCVVLHL